MSQPPANPIFVAIDTTSLEAAQHVAHRVAPFVGGIKLGLEFFYAHGPEGLKRMADYGLPIFLDAKLHDIPNTVAGAVRAITALPVTYVTIHASGGQAMLQAARKAADETAHRLHTQRPRLLGVTVLTSLDTHDLHAIGQDPAAHHQVDRLAFLAVEAGIDGVVCSAHETAHLRSRFATNIQLVVPGIRPSWETADDQKRVTAPAQAVKDGADILVIGRPITRATDPAQAAARIGEELGLPTPAPVTPKA